MAESFRDRRVRETQVEGRKMEEEKEYPVSAWLKIATGSDEYLTRDG